MKILKRDVKFKLYNLFKLHHSFNYDRYKLGPDDLLEPEYRGKYDFHLLLDVLFYFVRFYIVRDESSWYNLEVAVLGVCAPESNQLSLLGISRHYSWYTTDCSSYVRCIPPETTYNINLLWFFNLEVKITDHSQSVPEML